MCYISVQSNYIMFTYNKLSLIIIHMMGICVVKYLLKLEYLEQFSKYIYYTIFHYYKPLQLRLETWNRDWSWVGDSNQAISTIGRQSGMLNFQPKLHIFVCQISYFQWLSKRSNNIFLIECNNTSLVSKWNIACSQFES